MSDTSMTSLTEKTTIPLRVIVPVIASLIAATWMVSAQIGTVHVQLNTLSVQINEVNDRLEEAWSTQNMALWIARMQIENPSLKVPSITDHQGPHTRKISSQ